MSDVKPKRAVRRSEPSEISRGEAAPAATGPAIVPEFPGAAEIGSVPAAAVAEPAPEIVSAPVESPADSADDPWTSFAETQAVLAHGFEAIATEMTGMTRSGIAATADAAIALLTAKTFAEAIDINAGLARHGIDALVEGSAKLSEIGVNAIGSASRAILSRLGGAWSALGG